jgi:Ulp1 family protease
LGCSNHKCYRERGHIFRQLGEKWRHLFETVERWMTDDMKIRFNMDIDNKKWKFTNTFLNVPQQKNGHDCGVFSLLNIQYDIEDKPLDYNQSDVNLFFMRKRILYAILQETIGY